MEGGGDSMATRAALRQGMDVFLQPLKQAARDKGWYWNLSCRGPRGEAFRAFSDAMKDPHDTVCVLLVDAEGPVQSSARCHLEDQDAWDLSEIAAEHIHLMVQTMEAWFVADPASIACYYGDGFRRDALAIAQNPESVSKYNLHHWLRAATQDSSKGRYHKIRHASDLLKLIDRVPVVARCPHCKRLFQALGDMITAA